MKELNVLVAENVLEGLIRRLARICFCMIQQEEVIRDYLRGKYFLQLTYTVAIPIKMDELN